MKGVIKGDWGLGWFVLLRAGRGIERYRLWRMILQSVARMQPLLMTMKWLWAGAAACGWAAIAQLELPDAIKPKKLANTGFSSLFLQD
ncbi:MAG: hypothetical protein DCF32_01935 [Leptolyngbya sp.]|nr:MAG: hypothetical protein DCF32_01935 [Leptolyngbya sp.]